MNDYDIVEFRGSVSIREVIPGSTTVYADRVLETITCTYAEAEEAAAEWQKIIDEQGGAE